jgi:acyl-coenzyme A thioesterase PaaI-like protein
LPSRSSSSSDRPATGREELERWLASAAFNGFFRFRLRAFSAGECTIEAAFRDEFERPGGGICGPVFMAAADVAIWFAVATLRGTRERWVTADLKTAFLRAARHEPFTCTARVLRIGRHLAYVVAECARQDGNPLTHHTAIYVRTPTGAPQRRRANVER